MGSRAGYGTGSMRERRPGVYTLRVRVDGKQHQIDFHGTEAAARRELRSLPEKIKDQLGRESGDEPEKTVGQLLDEWLETLEASGRAPKTVHEHRRAVETIIRPMLGDIRLSALSAKHLDDLYGSLRKRGLSGSTVRRYHMVIQGSLSQAVKWGYLEENVARRASPPPATPSRSVQERYRIPEPPELERIINLAEPMMRVAIGLAAATGMRRGELCGLRWGDLDMKGGLTLISRSIWQTAGQWGVKGTKSDRERTILIGSYGVAVLQAWLVWTETDMPNANDYVLSNCADPVLPNTITERWSALCRRAGVEGVRFQDLRGDYVTALISGGVDPRTAAALAGHASAAMTFNRYARPVVPGAVEAARVNDSRLGRGLQPLKV